jgi:hypothetical protein
MMHMAIAMSASTKSVLRIGDSRNDPGMKYPWDSMYTIETTAIRSIDY